MDIRLDGIKHDRPGFSLAADLSIRSGASVAVIGPSGAGKSTLLGVIAGFEPTARGRVLLGGQDMTGVGPGARPVNMVFQDNNLFPHLTVGQNVGLGLDPALRLGTADRLAVAAVLERVGLEGHEGKRPAGLSGGQQSRVALARALLRDRPILLLDEPFAALGPALRKDMLDLVAALGAERGLTLVMVSHDPDDARRIAQDCIVVMNGTAAAPAPTRALLADPPPDLASYLG